MKKPDFMDEVTYGLEDYSDILDKDDRYDARAYDFIRFLTHDAELHRKMGRDIHFTAQDLIEAFHDKVLHDFGPLSMTVMTDWGIHSTEDIGEILFNLIASKRYAADKDDNKDDFKDGFDFDEAFVVPFE